MNSIIIVVDDNPGDVNLLQDILAAEGYEVRTYSHGELALRSIRAEETDLVLLDVRMPGVDGFEVCRQLKASPSHSDIPVIFLSCAAEVEHKLQGFLAGGVDYITKPFQEEEVVARIRTHVTLYHSRREMREAHERLRRNKDSLRLAQAIARLGHWEWEADSREVRWSDEAYRILGYEPRKFEPNHDALLSVVHPDDREELKKHLEQIWEGGDFDVEYRIVLPDGQVRVLHSVGEVVCFRGCGQPHILTTVQAATKHEKLTFIGVIQDVTERKELEQRLEAEAHTDALTGCATRRYFLELAQREVARVRRHQGVLSLLMLDLDRFKHINDLHGHQIGDLALQTLARVCRATLREEDVVGRLGGEEFAVLLQETSGELAGEVAERLRKAIAAVEIPLTGEQPLHFTASIGVAMLEPDDANVDVLLNRADRALYMAKEAGRNRVCVATGQATPNSRDHGAD